MRINSLLYSEVFHCYLIAGNVTTNEESHAWWILVHSMDHSGCYVLSWNFTCTCFILGSLNSWNINFRRLPMPIRKGQQLQRQQQICANCISTRRRSAVAHIGEVGNCCTLCRRWLVRAFQNKRANLEGSSAASLSWSPTLFSLPNFCRNPFSLGMLRNIKQCVTYSNIVGVKFCQYQLESLESLTRASSRQLSHPIISEVSVVAIRAYAGRTWCASACPLT